MDLELELYPVSPPGGSSQEIFTSSDTVQVPVRPTYPSFSLHVLDFNKGVQRSNYGRSSDTVIHITREGRS